MPSRWRLFFADASSLSSGGLLREEYRSGEENVPRNFYPSSSHDGIIKSQNLQNPSGVIIKKPCQNYATFQH
jgi:hypothetical protein